MSRKTVWAALLFAVTLMLASSGGRAASISSGTQTNSIPGALVDPLSSLPPSPLSADDFLLPIEITGARGLQDWSFDLGFNASTVAPLDLGGLYQSVYQSQFNLVDPTVSNITSSGFPGPGVLQGIAGFSSGASGDGTLAYILFQWNSPTHGDPGFSISNVTTQEQVPEPDTLALLGALLLISTSPMLRRVRGITRS